MRTPFGLWWFVKDDSRKRGKIRSSQRQTVQSKIPSSETGGASTRRCHAAQCININSAVYYKRTQFTAAVHLREPPPTLQGTPPTLREPHPPRGNPHPLGSSGTPGGSADETGHGRWSFDKDQWWSFLTDIKDLVEEQTLFNRPKDPLYVQESQWHRSWRYEWRRRRSLLSLAFLSIPPFHKTSRGLITYRPCRH